MTRGLSVTLVLTFALLPEAVHVRGVPSQTEPRHRPQFAYDVSRGCFDIDVYSVNNAQTEVLSVTMDLNREKLPTEKRPLVVDLARPPKGTEVQVHVYQTAKHDWPCTDVSFWGAEEPTTWVAKRGTLTVVAVPPTVNQSEYPVIVRLVNAEFAGPSGATIRPSKTLEIKTVAGRMVGG